MQCRVMKMKAMKKTMIKNSGGDDYSNRLLSFLNSQFTEKIIKMTKIRDAIFIVETIRNVYVLKGYPSFNKLRLQETFTATLRKEGFLKTYSFVQHLSKDPLIFEGKYFGTMEYLKPSRNAFSFTVHNNRLEGLAVLKEFHRVTSSVVPRYRTLLTVSDIWAKWQERMERFQKNFPTLQYFIKEKYILEMVDWATWSLNGMKENKEYFIEKPDVILHGDVAHHNFLRDARGTLHLIDFDLISIGPESLDYLQYANRIMPFLDWSLEYLYRHPQMQPFLKQQAFLYALAYPADIFREWNRLIREKTYSRSAPQLQVIELTLGQFYLRRKLVERLKKIVKEG